MNFALERLVWIHSKLVDWPVLPWVRLLSSVITSSIWNSQISLLCLGIFHLKEPFSDLPIWTFNFFPIVWNWRVLTSFEDSRNCKFGTLKPIDDSMRHVILPNMQLNNVIAHNPETGNQNSWFFGEMKCFWYCYVYWYKGGARINEIVIH